MLEKSKTIKELLGFFWQQKLWWIIPVIVIFLLLGIAIIFVGSSPIAPLVYPLF